MRDMHMVKHTHLKSAAQWIFTNVIQITPSCIRTQLVSNTLDSSFCLFSLKVITILISIWFILGKFCLFLNFILMESDGLHSLCPNSFIHLCEIHPCFCTWMHTTAVCSFLLLWSIPLRASLVAQLVKNPPAMRETWVQSLGQEDLLEKGKATHSSILAWRIQWTV